MCVSMCVYDVDLIPRLDLRQAIVAVDQAQTRM